MVPVILLSVSKYSTDTLYRAERTDELKADSKVHLRVDYCSSGVGSGACGSELKKEYRLAEKEFDFSVQFAPKKEGM